MTRKINPAGLSLVELSEGLRLTAYRCPAGVLTIGYGHTGRDVLPGQVITEGQALALLDADLAHAAAAVEHLVSTSLTGNQFAALVDFTFNAGEGSLAGSTLLKLVNSGDMACAADQFLVWDKAHVDGVLVVVPGLLTRRTRERALFLTTDDEEC